MRLPWELVDIVLDYAIEDLPVQDLLRARVSELFAAEIWNRLLHTNRLESEIFNKAGEPSWSTCPEGLRRRYLTHRLIPYPPQDSCWLSFMVNWFIEDLRRETPGMSIDEINAWVERAIEAVLPAPFRIGAYLDTVPYERWKNYPFQERHLDCDNFDIATAIMIDAIRKNDSNLLRDILASGVSPTTLCSLFRIRPFILAASEGSSDIMETMLKYSQWDPSDRYAPRATVAAMLSQNQAALDVWLAETNIFRGSRVVSWDTLTAAFLGAVRLERLELVQYLNEKCARPGISSQLLRVRALTGAIIWGKPESAAIVLQKPCSNRVAFAELLLENGVDPNHTYRDVTGTPLQIAVLQQDLPLTELLLKYGANPDACTSGGRRGRTPALLAAAKKRLLWHVRILLQYGADLAVLGKHGAA